jgi:hypothetical protein
MFTIKALGGQFEAQGHCSDLRVEIVKGLK